MVSPVHPGQFRESGGVMQGIPVEATHRGFGRTMRPDTWWALPRSIFVGLSAFVASETWAAFQGEHYTFGPYLSPFYAPEIADSPYCIKRFAVSRIG
jgi:hypothetical protein